MDEEKMLEEARWSQFAAGLLDYINCANSKFIKTDYQVKFNKPTAYNYELITATCMEDLSPELQRVANEYKEYMKNENNKLASYFAKN